MIHTTHGMYECTGGVLPSPLLSFPTQETSAVPGRSVPLVPKLSDQLGRDTVGTLELMYSPNNKQVRVCVCV